jgi:hypothetical protein
VEEISVDRLAEAQHNDRGDEQRHPEIKIFLYQPVSTKYEVTWTRDGGLGDRGQSCTSTS